MPVTLNDRVSGIKAIISLELLLDLFINRVLELHDIEVLQVVEGKTLGTALWTLGHSEQEICWVGVLSKGDSKGFDVLWHIFDQALINHVSIMQNQHSVKHLEHFSRRLMDSCNNGHLSEMGLSPSKSDNFLCGKTVKTTSRLIKHEQHWVSHHLVGDRASLKLSSRDTLDVPSSNICILTVDKSKLSEQDLYSSINFLLSHQVGSHFASKLQSLIHSQTIHEDIILLHEGTKSSEISLLHNLVVCLQTSKQGILWI
jgi:hypothetical protein